MCARRTGSTPETSRETTVGVPPQTALPRRTTATPEPGMEAQEAYLASPPLTRCASEVVARLPLRAGMLSCKETQVNLSQKNEEHG